MGNLGIMQHKVVFFLTFSSFFLLMGCVGGYFGAKYLILFEKWWGEQGGFWSLYKKELPLWEINST